MRRRPQSRRKTAAADVNKKPLALSRALDEALEQQAATFEVLRVIAGSGGDLKPVFASILRNAIRICEAKFGVHFRYDGNVLHAVAWEGVSPRFAKVLRAEPLHPGDESATGQAAQLREVVHLVDFKAERGGSNETLVKAALELGRVRTVLSVPMLDGDTLIGAITIYRQQVRPFTERQIELVTSFASRPSSPSRTSIYSTNCANAPAI